VTFVVWIVHKNENLLLSAYVNSELILPATAVVKSFIPKTTCKLKNAFRMQDMTLNATCHQLNNNILHFYNLWMVQRTSGFEANCSSTAETGTQTESHIMNHWKSDISLKLPKGVWKLYIFLLIIFLFCIIIHLVFLCRSRIIRALLKKTRKIRGFIVY